MVINAHFLSLISLFYVSKAIFFDKAFQSYFEEFKIEQIFLGLLFVNFQNYLEKETEPVCSEFDYDS